MMSFLKNKTHLILLILATLVIATTITSVSAANNMSFGNENGPINASYNQNINVNGTFDNITNDNGDLELNDDTRVFLAVYSAANGWEVVANTTPTRVSSVLTWSAAFNADMKLLGAYQVQAFWLNNYTTQDIYTTRNASTGVLTLEYRDTPKITITPTSGVKVGQNVTFLVTVTGRNASDASKTINLEGVNVTVIDQLGNFVADGITNGSGTFNFSHVVTALSFYFNATTNMSANASLSAAYKEVNASVPITATKGQANLTELWFGSPYGYVIGQNATILWNINGIDESTSGNRTITLFYYSNNKLQRTEVVPLLSNINIDGRAADGHWNTTFTQAHTNLTVIAVFAEDADYLRSEQRNSTFVDVSNESRRTTVNYTLPSIGLKVGQTSDIEIRVFSFNGTPVQAGTVTVIWDGRADATFYVDIINGVGRFIHTYNTANTARNVTFAFNGDDIGNAPSNVTGTVPVLKGTPSIVLTQQPVFAVVGQAVTIAGAINNIALGTTPKYVTLQFKSTSGNVVHTINNISMTANTANSAIAQVTYTYIQTHPSLQLVMTFAGDNNYNATSGTTTTIVSAAPVI